MSNRVLAKQLALTFLSCVLAATPVFGGENSASLNKYAQFDAGPNFNIVKTDHAANGFVRTVDTTSGEKNVVVAEGYRVLVAFQETEPFANIKVERLSSDTYAEDRRNLVDQIRKLAKEPGNSEREFKLNGFDLVGLDRKELTGGVLSMYLVINDEDHTVVTLYLLNEEPTKRKFNTLQAYTEIRDEFLNRYTKSVHEKLKAEHSK